MSLFDAKSVFFLMKNTNNVVPLQAEKGNQYEYCRIKWPV